MNKVVKRYEVKGTTVRFACPHHLCRTKLRDRLDKAGQSDKCPECQTAFVMPGVAELAQLKLAKNRKAEAAKAAKEKAKAEKAAKQEAAEKQKREKAKALLANAKAAEVNLEIEPWKAPKTATVANSNLASGKPEPPARQPESRERKWISLSTITQLLTCFASILICVAIVVHWVWEPLTHQIVESRLKSTFEAKAERRGNRLTSLLDDRHKGAGNDRPKVLKAFARVSGYSVSTTDSLTSPFMGTIIYEEIELTSPKTVVVSSHSFPVKYQGGKWLNGGDGHEVGDRYQLDVTSPAGSDNAKFLESLLELYPAMKEYVTRMRGDN